MMLFYWNFLHKFYNKVDIPWVHLVWDNHYDNGQLPGQYMRGSFWWRDIVKLLDTYKDFDGSIILF